MMPFGKRFYLKLRTEVGDRMFWIKKRNKEMVEIYLTRDEPFVKNINQEILSGLLTDREFEMIKPSLEFAANLLGVRELSYDVYEVEAKELDRLHLEFNTNTDIAYCILVSKTQDQTQKVYVCNQTVDKFGERPIKELLGLLEK